MTTERWLPLADSRQIRREVHRAARGVHGYLVAAIVAMVAAAVLDLTVPMATGWVIDAARAHRPSSALLTPALVMVGAVIGSGICNGAGQALTPSFFSTIVTRLRESMIAAGLELDQQQVERAGTADLVSRASDDVTAVRDAANGALPRLVNTTIMVVVSVGAVGSLHPAFLVPVLAGAVLYGLAIHAFMRAAPPVYRAERRASTTQSQHILSTIHGLDVVRAFGLEKLRTLVVADGSWQAVRWGLRGRFLSNTLVVRLLAGEAVATIGVAWTGFLLVRHGSVSVGAASAAVLLLLRLFSPVRFLLMFLDTLQEAWVCLQRIVGVVSTRRKQPVGPAVCRPSTRETRGVDVAHLHFGYDGGPEVLHDVSLEVAPGHTMVLVGESGAGKSTLAALVAGLLEPGSGTVSAGARTVLVSQEIHTFSGSLLDDVALGLPPWARDWDDAHVREAVTSALARVGAGEWVAGLPEGLDTVVGRLGVRPSPARAQQIALARALLADPDVVILDEATAEAGSSGAAVLDRAAAEVVSGRTAIVVAHRLSQVRMADEVAVMDSGRIVEVGPPLVLAAGDGPFARLWQVWTQRH